MGIGKEVRELLQQGREEALTELALADSRALRPLVGRLWDSDSRIRNRAARVIGRAAAAHEAVGEDLVRRLVWALNDESGTNGIYGIPALGEIGRHAPRLLAAHVPVLVALCRDDGLRLQILRALAATAESDPALVAGEMSRLETWVDASRPEERQTYGRLVELTAGRDGSDV